MKLLRQLEKQHTTWFLLGISFIFFLLRLPSFFEPYWYGDEGIYEVIGFALNHGRDLYTGIWDNKPPLLYLTYALFDGSQVPVRILSCVFGILTTIALFFLAKRLFGSEDKKLKISMLVTGIFALLFSTPLLEGNIANAENFMLLPIFVAAFLILLFAEKEKHNPSTYARVLVLPGLLLGLAFLFKVVAVFDFATFFVFLFILRYKNLKSVVKQIVSLTYFTTGFFAPLLLTMLFFLLKGSLKTFIQSAFLSNVGYVGYGNKLFFPQGLLVLKLILLFSFIFFVWKNRTKWSETQIFIGLWLAFSIFNALFSQRPYIHYALVLLGSSSLFLGLIILEKRIRLQLGIIAALVVFFIVYNFPILSSIQKNIFEYYANYLSYTMTKKTTEEYIAFFDKSTVRDYALKNFLNTMTPPFSLFIWGNNGQLYRLAGALPPGRYIVAYHITSSQKTLDETFLALKKNPPTFILIMPDQPQFPFALTGYKPRFNIDNTIIYEKTF